MTEFTYLSQVNLRDQQIVKLVAKNDVILLHALDRIRNMRTAIENSTV
jgi:hypothetical protein